jgi:hypothetical protein
MAAGVPVGLFAGWRDVLAFFAVGAALLEGSHISWCSIIRSARSVGLQTQGSRETLRGLQVRRMR